jgi:uncharacterized protein YbaR (Trm112 family)
MAETLDKVDRLAETFVCPKCPGRLERAGESLVCTKEGDSFPVVGGMPRFVGELSAGSAQAQEAYDFEHGRYEDSDYTVFGPQLIDQFLQRVDLFQLPFEPKAYHFVMSWGVLHHTPSTKQAFDKIVPLVRPGGTLYVMVYEVNQGWSERGTNAVRWLLQRVSSERLTGGADTSSSRTFACTES